VYFTSSPSELCAGGRTVDLDAIKKVCLRGRFSSFNVAQLFCQVIGDSNATVSIEVMDYLPVVEYVTPMRYWPDIDDALRAAAFRGVQVRFLVSLWDYSRSVG
jgi:hypothetical protein